MVKRKTPEDDPDRLADRLRDRFRNKIQDRDSFDLAFNRALELRESELTSKQKTFRNQTFKSYLSKNENVSQERLFTKAKGKDLKRDRLVTAQEVVETREEFVKKGARKVDLKGFDTARQKLDRKIARKRLLIIPSRVRGKVVFSERTFVVIRGKKIVRFRDSKGRFASKK